MHNHIICGTHYIQILLNRFSLVIHKLNSLCKTKQTYNHIGLEYFLQITISEAEKLCSDDIPGKIYSSTLFVALFY